MDGQLATSHSDEEVYEDCLEEQELDTDEEFLVEKEKSMTEEERRQARDEADRLKQVGNQLFKEKEFKEAEKTYSCGLTACPLSCTSERAVLYSNRAAARCYIATERSKSKAIDDCSKAIKCNPNYLKPYLRRASLYKDTEKLDESLADYKKALELDPGNKEARITCYELEQQINERNEKLKTEMLGKLKDLGNMVLKPFGMSTENFQLQQNPETGGYSINFKQ